MAKQKWEDPDVYARKSQWGAATCALCAKNGWPRPVLDPASFSRRIIPAKGRGGTAKNVRDVTVRVSVPGKASSSGRGKCEKDAKHDAYRQLYAELTKPQ